MNTDLTLGIYRRIYSGFLTGKRINAVSWQAEAWFWRLHALADDYGNLMADAAYLRAHAAPRRKLTIKQADALTAELEQAGLIRRYTDGSDSYASIIGFTQLQPSGRNGRRYQRHPLPDAQKADLGNPGESGGIRGNPGESGKSKQHHNHHHHQNHNQDHNHHQNHDQSPPVGGEEGESAAPSLAVAGGGGGSEPHTLALADQAAWTVEQRHRRRSALLGMGIGQPHFTAFMGNAAVTQEILDKIYREAKAKKAKGTVTDVPAWCVGAINGELSRRGARAATA